MPLPSLVSESTDQMFLKEKANKMNIPPSFRLCPMTTDNLLIFPAAPFGVAP
jgi:hypothetical protein